MLFSIFRVVGFMIIKEDGFFLVYNWWYSYCFVYSICFIKLSFNLNVITIFLSSTNVKGPLQIRQSFTTNSTRTR